MGLVQSGLGNLGFCLLPFCSIAQKAWSIMTAPRVPTIGDRLPRRTAWADLADSSQECSKDCTPAPLVDDSYDTPASGVEGHKDGLTSRFSRSLLKAGPIDFSFLDDAGSPGKKFKAAGSALTTHPESSGSTSEPQTLNASAPIFVPTLQRQPTSPKDMPPPAVPQAAGKSKRIRGKRALSSLSTLPDQGSQKRNKEQDRPVAGDASVAVAAQPKVLQNFLEPPPATEEEWRHRIAKRLKVVTAIKETPEYQSYAALKAPSARLDGEPRTPTAEDRNLSKRRWEYEIQQWRTQLKTLAAGDDAMGELEETPSPEA